MSLSLNCWLKLINRVISIKGMSYSFEYIDIILLAMIAGFIFLRLRGILGKRTGFEGKAPGQFKEVIEKMKNR